MTNLNTNIHDDMAIILCKKVCKNVKDQHVLNWINRLFGQKYRVATLSTFYLDISGIIILNFKSLGQL